MPVFLPTFTDKMLLRTPKSFLTGFLFALPVSVSFFFVLSGYVLAVVYLREGKQVDKRKFFVARFARIYPLFFVTLVLDTPPLLFDKIHRSGGAIGSVKTAAVFLGHIAMLQAWSVRFYGIDGPNWSLSAETFFYLCFPVLGFWLWKLRGAWVWVAAFCLYVGGQLLVLNLRPHPSSQMDLPLLHLSTFALGILLARWQTSRAKREDATPIRAWQASGLLAVVFVALLLSVKLTNSFSIIDLLYTGLLAPVFAAMIWALSSTTTLASRWLCADWLVALGNASFALYLIHTPMLHLFEFFHWQKQPGAYPIYLVTCVGLSVLSFTAFETPVRVWLVDRIHARSLETKKEVSVAQ
jgi:peptidoglycan/LPS O-acetylase OafA/YrhL